MRHVQSSASASRSSSTSRSNEDRSASQSPRQQIPFFDKVLHIDEQAADLPDDPQRENNAQRYVATALTELVDEADDAQKLERITDRCPPQLLRDHPRLLLAITRKFVSVTQYQPQELGRTAEICLDAAIGAGNDTATAVWTSLSEALQEPDLPMGAAHRLLDCLQAKQAHLPQDAIVPYTEARTHMNQRELEFQAYQREVLALYGRSFDPAFERAQSLPKLPSQYTRL